MSLSPEKEAQRLKDYNEGLNDYELAERWQKNLRTVQHWRHKRGLSCHPKQREVPKRYRKYTIRII